MGVSQRLDAYQRRHRWLGLPIAVVYKFFDDQGVYLAVLITHYAFLSIFPLLLISSSILGFVLQGNSELRDRILADALRQFPVFGDQLGRPGVLKGSVAAIVVGAITTVYGSLGVSLAVQNAMNVAWAVPRNRRPNPIQLRLRGVRLLVTVGVAFAGTTVLSAISNRTGSFSHGAVSAATKLVLVVLAVGLNAAMFSLVFRMATTRDVTFREAIPGAVLAAVLWQLVQAGGALYIRTVIRDATTTNGVFAIVLGILGWLYVGSASMVLCAELNVVLTNELHPRALLTPFSERVDLTTGDRAAYTAYAKAQRHKGFEDITVTFEADGQFARRASDRGTRAPGAYGRRRTDRPPAADAPPVETRRAEPVAHEVPGATPPGPVEGVGPAPPTPASGTAPTVAVGPHDAGPPSVGPSTTTGADVAPSGDAPPAEAATGDGARP